MQPLHRPAAGLGADGALGAMPLRERPVAASHASRSQVQLCEEARWKPRVATSLRAGAAGCSRLRVRPHANSHLRFVDCCMFIFPFCTMAAPAAGSGAQRPVGAASTSSPASPKQPASSVAAVSTPPASAPSSSAPAPPHASQRKLHSAPAKAQPAAALPVPVIAAIAASAAVAIAAGVWGIVKLIRRGKGRPAGQGSKGGSATKGASTGCLYCAMPWAVSGAWIPSALHACHHTPHRALFQCEANL